MKHFPIIGSFLVLLLSAGLVGAASEIGRLILARVGDQQITGAAFREFSRRVPEGFKKGGTREETDRNLLESLIDKKLLSMEAQAMAIEDDPWFKEQMEQELKAGLLAFYRERQIVDQIAVTDGEIQQHYRATGRDRALRYGILMVATQEEARQMHDALKAGADFGELASKHSLHRETRERGGDTGLYQAKDQMSPLVAERVFHLQVGDISDPVPLRYDDQNYFVVFTILAEQPAPLEASAAIIREEIAARKRAALLQALVDSAKTKYRPRIDQGQLQGLAQRIQAAGQARLELPASEGESPLCTYEGGRITLADFLQAVQAIPVDLRELADRAQVETLLRDVVVPQHLLIAEARSAGLEEDPDLRAALARKREELVLMALYRRSVNPEVSVSDAEARAFYDTYPERFLSPETTIAVEILVLDETMAQQLKEKLLEGADAEQLARQYTVRPGGVSHRGRIRLNASTQALFPAIYEETQKMEVGEVGGPVETPSGFSVFKIANRGREKAPYDEETRRLAKSYAGRDKAKNEYARYLRDLRQRYPVQIDTENLRRFSASRNP